MFWQWQQYARGYNVAVVLAGNKVQTAEDVAFLRQYAGDDLLTWIGHEPAIRAMEQGRPFSRAGLSAQTSDALAVLHRTLDSQRRDWDKYARQAAEFHSRNAQAWANAASGQDLTGQIDPGFTLDPLVFSS